MKLVKYKCAFYLKGGFPDNIDMTRIVHAFSLEDNLLIPNEDWHTLKQATHDYYVTYSINYP